MNTKPTMKEVAAAAGVSVMTVSRAFRSDASISDDTRERIRKVADELGYVFDAVASNLRSQRSGFVAVTIPSINNANFADTVGALTSRLDAAGLQVLLGRTNYDMAEEERLIGQLLRRQPEALVVTGGHHTDRARKMMQNAAIPVIETWDLPAPPLGHVVGFSNADAMRVMVAHLTGRGYRKIAFIGGDFDLRHPRRRPPPRLCRRDGGDGARPLAADHRGAAADLDAAGRRCHGDAAGHAARYRGGDRRGRPRSLRGADRMCAARHKRAG